MELLQHPIVEGLMVAVIFIALLVEIKTAGFSGGGLVAALFGVILLWSHWDDTTWAMTEILLFFGGLLLIFVDLLLLGTGAIAAAGLVSMMASLYFLLGGNVSALYVLSGGLVLAGIGIWTIAERLSENTLWKKISLAFNLTSQKGYVSSQERLTKWEGATGVARSVLRPAGKVEIDGHILDAVTEGDFVEAQKPVLVVRAESNRIVVREIKE